MYEGCPPGIANDGSENYNNVSMLPTLSRGDSPSFSFEITRHHVQVMRKMYIKCLMGLCASVNIGLGNIGQVSSVYFVFFKVGFHIINV